MKNWFKKIGQKLYGKTPAGSAIKIKRKKSSLKKKLSTEIKINQPQLQIL